MTICGNALNTYADWAGYRNGVVPLWSQDRPLPEVRSLLQHALGGPEAAVKTRSVTTWVSDGVAGRELAWSVGFGPETRAWVIRPVGEQPLPGVVAMHCHSNFTFFGKEKIADGPNAPHPSVATLREQSYSSRPWANELARRGFVVMVHDVFLWGSRRFAIPGVASGDVDSYNHAAMAHEHVVAKYAASLGTSVAAMVAREDRIALDVLAGLPDVRQDRLGTAGFSGGGLRAALLNATSPQVSAAVITAMMSSLRPLQDAHVIPHTWMLFDPAFARIADLPVLAAAGLPSSLLVQYGRTDPMFPDAGRAEAHRVLSELSHAHQRGYKGSFHDVGHEFGSGLQDEAFDWLADALES